MNKVSLTQERCYPEVKNVIAQPFFFFLNFFFYFFFPSSLHKQPKIRAQFKRTLPLEL